MDNPYRSPRTDEDSDGTGGGWGSFGRSFGGYGHGSPNGGDMNDPNDPSLPEPWNWPGSSHQQYQDELQNALNFARHQAQPAQQNQGNSFVTTTERYCGCSLHGTLAPYTEHRRLVNYRTGFGSRPTMLAFRAERVLQNAARASNAYNEPAGNSMTLTIRPRLPQASQNTAEERFTIDQAAADRELAWLAQQVESFEADPERLAQVAVDIAEAAGMEDHQPWDFVRQSGSLAAHEALPPRMLLNYDGSGNPAGPERVNLWSYPLFSDDSWCDFEDDGDYTTFGAAGFYRQNVCSEWKNRFDANVSIYRRDYCGRHFAKECQTMMDNHTPWHVYEVS
jgi:hypothetical protein